jgi:hypothetical protein
MAGDHGDEAVVVARALRPCRGASARVLTACACGLPSWGCSRLSVRSYDSGSITRVCTPAPAPSRPIPPRALLHHRRCITPLAGARDRQRCSIAPRHLAS